MKAIKKASKIGYKGAAVLLCAAMVATSGALSFAGNIKLSAAAATDDYLYYTKDSDWYNDAVDTAQQIAAEGMVLMKNDGLLPLKKKDDSKVRISIFGKHSASIIDRGFGSSDINYGFGSFYGGFDSTTYNKTFEYNPALKNFYQDTAKSGAFLLNYTDGYSKYGSLDSYRPGLPTWETPYSSYTDTVKNSYSDYSDAAVVVLSRYGGEGTDLPTTSLKDWTDMSDANKLDNARSWDSHYLQLDKNEVEMLQNVMENFENIVILLNSNNPLEMGFLNDPTHYLYTDNGFAERHADDMDEMMARLRSVLYVGFPGQVGCNIIPRLLDGTITPSGHLSDTWERNFMDNPVMRNFGFNGSQYGNKAADSASTYVHYDEDIYLGYRYYETRYADTPADERDVWYQEEVMFPFGYGLSYTEFDWELLSCVADTDDGKLSKDGTITTTVKVTNTGDYAGKEVVQLYYNTPYYAGGISKAHVVLGDFAKTRTLEPGESQTVAITTKISDMYSYDWSDANGNGFKGYELEAGGYNITVAKDAHEAAKLIPDYTTKFTLTDGWMYMEDTTTGAEIHNLFDDVSGTGMTNSADFMGVRQYMQRNDFEGTYPSAAADKQSVKRTENQPAVTPAYDDGKPWYSDTMPTQAAEAGTAETNTIKLWHMIGRDYDDPLWDKLMDQLTYEEMANMVGNASLHTEGIASIDKIRTDDWDGPLGRRNSGGIQWPSNTLLGQTFNKELAYKEGVGFGNTALNAFGGGSFGMTYGVAMNIHRSHFGGRGMEYYSEDGVLSGKLAAEVIKGAASKGDIQTLKHFVINDQETSRNLVQTWASEQAIREIYAKPFEIAVKEGGANALMAGVNSIGNTSCAESWALMTGLLRNEWGFKGFVITDMVTKNPDRSIRAGTDLMMAGGNEPKIDAASLTATQATNLRKSIKNVLYVMANSAMVQGLGGEQLDFIEYGGANTLYAVEGVDNTLEINKANNEFTGNDVLRYALLEGSALPEGMELTENGIITGAPEQAGEYRFSVVVSENTNARYPLKPKVKNYSVKIYERDNLPDNIIFEDDDLGVIPYGYAFSKSIDSAVAFDAEGRLVKNVRYSVAEGSTLPAGLKLENGVISGVATGNPGTYFFTIKAESDGREDAYLDFIVTVKSYNIYYPKVDIEQDISVGDSVAINIASAMASEDIEVSYKLKTGSTLPDGLYLSSTGIIAGTVTRACTDHEFTVVASADMAEDKEVTYSITVKGIVLEDTDFGVCLINKNYLFNLGGVLNDGGQAKVTYSLKEGEKLPYGFTLLSDGTLYGNCDELGEVSFVVEASADGYVTVEATVTLTFDEIYESEIPDGEIASPIEDESDSGTTNKKSGCKGSAESTLITVGCMSALAAAAVIAKRKIKK